MREGVTMDCKCQRLRTSYSHPICSKAGARRVEGVKKRAPADHRIK